MTGNTVRRWELTAESAEAAEKLQLQVDELVEEVEWMKRRTRETAAAVGELQSRR